MTVPASGQQQLRSAGGAPRDGAAFARPDDTAGVRAAVRDAVAAGTRLRLVGRGTWLAAGRPVTDARPLHLDALAGIVDYVPGDLTLTARAGTTLAEIAAVTAAEGQWLALAPWGGDAGSLGATVATATAGPMSGAVGTPRDLVIGVEVVTGAGDVVRGGGRVVKNVAGFDLTRLMVGAWGTLGAITEISVRLRALPEHETTVALRLPNGAAPLAELLARLRGAAVAPSALELIGASLARRLGVGSEPALLASLAGNAELVAAQREALASLASIADVAPDVWTRLRAAEPADAIVARLSSPVARFAETWANAERLAAAVDGGFAHASVLRSVARVVMGGSPDGTDRSADDPFAAIPRGTGETRIFERLPNALWPSLAPTAAGDRLSRGVRDAFDPRHILNPGILGEEGA